MIWSGIKNGFFSIRSAYKYVLEFSISLIGSASDDRLKIRQLQLLAKNKAKNANMRVFYGIYFMQIMGNYVNSGNCYGDYIFLIKLNTLLGRLTRIFYLLKKILCANMYSVMIYVRSAELVASL